ncbi:hypothetical protein BUUB107078_09255 [Burkholderia ubonensis]|nr:hypothetical protein BUB20358_04165 [Burkholderia ubonensis]
MRFRSRDQKKGFFTPIREEPLQSTVPANTEPANPSGTHAGRASDRSRDSATCSGNECRCSARLPERRRSVLDFAEIEARERHRRGASGHAVAAHPAEIRAGQPAVELVVAGRAGNTMVVSPRLPRCFRMRVNSRTSTSASRRRNTDSPNSRSRNRRHAVACATCSLRCYRAPGRARGAVDIHRAGARPKALSGSLLYSFVTFCRALQT